jgi:hypothetical protein
VPARGEVVLGVSFGPAATPVLERAVALAGEHAEDLERVGGKTWRATFRLGSGEGTYGRALQLVHMVYGWRATTMEVSGSPEHRAVIAQMLHCAREWLRSNGACRATFAGPRTPAKCRACPLYDPGWTLESFSRPSSFLSMGGESGLDEPAPDYVPSEWVDQFGPGEP